MLGRLMLAAVIGINLAWSAAAGAAPAGDDGEAKVWIDLGARSREGWSAIPAAAGGSADFPIAGSLPRGFADNSAWAKAAIDYGKKEEESLPFLRWDVRKIADGASQLRVVIPPLSQRYFFHLAIKGRAANPKPFKVGIRQVGVPYKMLWTREVSFGNSWDVFSYDFILEPTGDAVGFWLICPFVNTIDLAQLKLEATPVEALKAAAQRGEGPANLLQHSRFPLGLPAEANIDRDTSDGDCFVVEPDAAQPGPSGAPALKLERIETASVTVEPRIIGEPFAVREFWRPHTLSLAVKGSGGGSLRIVEEGKVVAKTDFAVAPGDGWTRKSVSYSNFKPGVPYQYELAPAGTSPLWIDAVQVAPDGQADYLSARRPEVDFAAVPRSRVYLEGEPARVRYQVTGDTAGLTMKSRVVDLYGDEKALPDIPLKADASLAGTLPFDVFPARPFGAFRVEAWLEDGQGKAASATFEIAVLRVRPPRNLAEDAPSSPFGVHTCPTLRQLELAKRVGANWVRLHDSGLNDIGWQSLEPQKGQWRFHDADIDRYRASHLMILGELGTAPAWATKLADIGPHDRYFDRFYQPKNLQDYRNYVQTVVKRYHDRISAWDVWNEPWNHFFWIGSYDPAKTGRAAYQTSAEPAKDYVALNRVAKEAVKEIDPSAVVDGFSTTVGDYVSPDLFSGNAWTAMLAEAHGADVPDVIDYHEYLSALTLFPGDQVENYLQPILKARGDRKIPIWMTEGSSVSGLTGAGFYRYSLPFPMPANFYGAGTQLCRFVLSQLANGVERVFLYTMHGHDYFSTDPQWRVLVGNDGYPHPSAAAYANMTHWIEGTRFVERVDLPSGVPVYLFTGGGRTVAVFAPRPDDSARRVPPDVSAMDWYDLYGNPQAGEAVPESGLAYGVTTAQPGAVRRLLQAN